MRHTITIPKYGGLFFDEFYYMIINNNMDVPNAKIPVRGTLHLEIMTQINGPGFRTVQ